MSDTPLPVEPPKPSPQTLSRPPRRWLRLARWTIGLVLLLVVSWLAAPRALPWALDLALSRQGFELESHPAEISWGDGRVTLRAVTVRGAAVGAVLTVPELTVVTSGTPWRGSRFIDSIVMREPTLEVRRGAAERRSLEELLARARDRESGEGSAPSLRIEHPRLLWDETDDELGPLEGGFDLLELVSRDGAPRRLELLALRLVRGERTVASVQRMLATFAAPQEGVYEIEQVAIVAPTVDLRDRAIQATAPTSTSVVQGGLPGPATPILVRRLVVTGASVRARVEDRGVEYPVALDAGWVAGHGVRVEGSPPGPTAAAFVACGAESPHVARGVRAWGRLARGGYGIGGATLARLALGAYAPQLRASGRVSHLTGEVALRADVFGTGGAGRGVAFLEGRGVRVAGVEEGGALLDSVLDTIGRGGEVDLRLPFRLRPELTDPDSPTSSRALRFEPSVTGAVAGAVGGTVGDLAGSIGSTIGGFFGAGAETPPARRGAPQPGFAAGSTTLEPGSAQAVAWLTDHLAAEAGHALLITACADPGRDGPLGDPDLQALATDRAAALTAALLRSGDVAPSQIVIEEPHRAQPGERCARGVRVELRRPWESEPLERKGGGR
jgi:hypothetical protein